MLPVLNLGRRGTCSPFVKATYIRGETGGTTVGMAMGHWEAVKYRPRPRLES